MVPELIPITLTSFESCLKEKRVLKSKKSAVRN